MKKKEFVAGILVGGLLMGALPVSASVAQKTISINYNDIKIVVDGQKLETSSEPFIYNGTTYLPVRAVSQAVGKEVFWDGATSTVYLGESPVEAQPSVETPVEKPVQPNPVEQAAVNNTGLDFANDADFEAALNAGEDLTGKTVRVTVSELHPKSAFGYNIWAGEHLNFVSAHHPGVKDGDVIDVKVTEIMNNLGSWIIRYEKL